MALIAYIVNLYFLLKILIGQHGILEIHKQIHTLKYNSALYTNIQGNNNIAEIKSGLINDDIISIRYFSELLRLKYSVIQGNEKVVILNQ
ncbi:MAG: hypothetical protein ACI9CD_001202 [Candidatus Deianiraeaceae bacterium]|jgi:hypothetical protein